MTNEDMKIIRVERPPQLVSIDTLLSCRDGLVKRMKKTKKKLERDRLKDIKDEIDFLIEAL